MSYLTYGAVIGFTTNAHPSITSDDMLDRSPGRDHHLLVVVFVIVGIVVVSIPNC